MSEMPAESGWADLMAHFDRIEVGADLDMLRQGLGDVGRGVSVIPDTGGGAEDGVDGGVGAGGAGAGGRLFAMGFAGSAAMRQSLRAMRRRFDREQAPTAPGPGLHGPGEPGPGVDAVADPCGAQMMDTIVDLFQQGE